MLNEEQQRVAFESYVESLTPEGRVAFFKKAQERWDQAEKADKTQKKRKKEIRKVEAPSSSGCESGTESRKKKVLRAAEPVVNVSNRYAALNVGEEEMEEEPLEPVIRNAVTYTEHPQKRRRISGAGKP